MGDVQTTYSEQQRAELLNLARCTIVARLGLDSEVPERTSDPALLEPRGAFVTLHKKGMLRGCIGQIEAVRPLWDTVAEMAVAAAFQDPRFPPVTAEELDEIDLEISALSPLSKVTNPDEIEVGRHGLFIEKGVYSGLLLPQVASSRNWDVPTFLRETCYKAGLDSDDWETGATIWKFEAEIFRETT